MKSESIPRPEYPRPQFERENWINLNGAWTCFFDFGKSGVARGLNESKGFEKDIAVPFCPESGLSGIGHKDFIEMMWYHRKIAIPEAWRDKLVMLNFGAVDYEAEVFVNGKSAGTHWGGSSSFSVDISKFVEPGKDSNLVVLVRDELRSGVQAIGKQSPEFESHGCVYTRTTGIWQTVWMEAVSPFGLESCRIIPDFDNGKFIFAPEFVALQKGMTLCVEMPGEAKVELAATNGCPFELTLKNPRAWSQDDPFLYDIVFKVIDKDKNILDEVKSYAGLRKVHIEGNKFFLNNEPLYFRFVLDQGFYPDGIWTAPSDEAIKQDIIIAQRAGFNGARLHQKVFEERFHYWADKLGYLTWGESANWGMCLWKHGGGRMNIAGMCRNFISEWREILERDMNHPSIIAWTPLNETSGAVDWVEHQRFVRELYDLTRQLDPTRPVNDSSGYVHVKTDLWTVHNYSRPEKLKEEMVIDKDKGVWRNFPDNEVEYTGQPYIVDEMGGLSWNKPEVADDEAWGYGGVLQSENEFYSLLKGEIDALLGYEHISGYCYTQLTDVEQEQNGIYSYDRTLKFDMNRISQIFSKKSKGYL